ncbi:hypothetical protein [Arthrobacter sp. StoSoilB22]|uniref:hypothetical protein n=1 Tax=Arthrobacter sp. StoSoilB22 TaxID=2830996 RepID=UPI001CC701DD|nr:hypothetical protein [Arthrobacter sp. StoSoilB22]BCW61377.1 hypothetical protein StoSoilB22_03500 [Arthrobacter sp. StoSoilB22]
MRRSVRTTENGVQYRDVNGDGVLDPYEDPLYSYGAGLSLAPISWKESGVLA